MIISLLNFNFYSDGNTPESSLLEKSLPTILGIVIGFLLNRGFEYYREQNTIERAGEEFINELELFKDPLEKQIKSIENIIKQLNDVQANNISLEGNIPIDIDRINVIDRLYVYKYFKKLNKKDKKEGRRVVNKLYGTLKVCFVESERMKVMFDNFINSRSEEVKNFNKCLNLLLGDYASLIVSLEKEGIKPENDSLCLSLNPIFDNFKDIEKMNIIEITEKICTPLAHTTAKFRLDVRSEIFSFNNRGCFTCYREYMSIKNSFLFQIVNIQSTLSKSNEQLVQHLNKYGPTL